MQLVALQGVVLAADGGRHHYLPGDALPAMPDDQAERLVRLGAARVAEPAAAALARPKAKSRAPAKPAAEAEAPL